jgi:hypothetical protein
MRKTVMMVLLCLVSFQVLVLAGPQSTPTVDQLLDKYVAALGGKAAIQKTTSFVMKGTFDLPAMGVSGATMEGGAKAPNKSFASIEIPGFGTITQGYNGTVSWQKDPQSGLRELSGAELASSKRDGEFYKDIKLKELYPKMVLKGKDKVGDKDVFVIEATPPDGSAEKWYFDAQSGLLIRKDVENETPNGKMAFEVYMEDYRDVDGVKVPFTERRMNPSFSYTVKITEIKRNVAVDDAKFNKPAEK